MKNRSLILSAAVVAAGLFVLPATVSMFAGQHSWYDPKDQGIPCEKCHWLEYEEMRGVERTDHVPHVGVSRGVEWAFDCEECHSVTMNISSHHHNGTIDHTPAHAATTLSCLDCHGGELYGKEENSSIGWYDIPMHNLADKYGQYWPITGHSSLSQDCYRCHRNTSGVEGHRQSFIEHVDDELLHPRAAHRSFFLAMQGEDTQLTDANEACLGCHSRIGVNITWTRNSHVSYHVTCDKSGYNVSWNTSDNLGTNRTVFGSTSGWD